MLSKLTHTAVFLTASSAILGHANALSEGLYQIQKPDGGKIPYVLSSPSQCKDTNVSFEKLTSLQRSNFLDFEAVEGGFKISFGSSKADCKKKYIAVRPDCAENEVYLSGKRDENTVFSLS